MKRFSIATLVCLLGFSLVSAQQLAPLSPDRQKPAEYLKMSGNLYKIYEASLSGDQDPYEIADLHRLYVREDGRIKLEVVYGHDTELSIDHALLENRGFMVDGVYRNRCNVWVAPDEILNVESLLPDNYLLYMPVLGDTDHESSPARPLNQGPGLMNSDSYGTAGSGIDVAILDQGFDLYSTADAANAVPPVGEITYYSHGNGTLESGTQQHGTACVETVYDHVPNADYFLHKVISLTDLGNAVNDCESDGVDIISYSVSHFNTGWNNNSGSACAAANDASNDNIFFFNSAGNYNDQEHVQRSSFVGGGNNWHDWSGSDELNSLSVGAGCTLNVALQWSDDPDFVNDDYDLFLYSSGGTELASSESGGDFEILSWTNSSASAANVGIAVWQDGTDNNAFEIFTYGSCGWSLQYSSTSNNTASPMNSTGANVMVIGAVYRTDYNDAAGTNPITGYSSRGPTNQGTTNLDFVAPAGTTTVAYSGDFNGTSCSCPNAAGATAAFWSRHSFLSATGIRHILRAKADLYHDWGSNGLDNTYGYGGIGLYDYHSLNRYIISTAGNSGSISSLPYYSMDDVDDDGVPSGLRMIYLQTADILASGNTSLVTKPMLYKSATTTVID